MGGSGYGFPAASFSSGPAIAGQPKSIPDVLKATMHVNYESSLAEYHDDLPKFLDFPVPYGSGKICTNSLRGLCQNLYAAFGRGRLMPLSMLA
jgi:hypothetical protein